MLGNAPILFFYLQLSSFPMHHLLKRLSFLHCNNSLFNCPRIYHTVFMTLIILKRTGIFCYFSHDQTVVVDLGEKNTTELKSPSHHIISGRTWYPHYITVGEVDLHHWVKMLFAVFLQCKITVFHSPSLFFITESLSQPCLQGQKGEDSSHRGKVSI